MSADDRQQQAEQAIAEFRQRGMSRGGMLEALAERGFTEYEADCVLDGHGLPPRESAGGDPAGPLSESAGVDPAGPRSESVGSDPPGPWSASPTLDPGPTGIGGWLLLPALSLLVGLDPLIDELRALLELLGSEQLPEVAAQYPGFEFGLKLALAALVALLVLHGVAALLFFTKNHRAPMAMMVLIAARAILPLGIALCLSSILGEPLDTKELAMPLFSAGIWIPYFRFSVRVQNTFVRRWSFATPLRW